MPIYQIFLIGGEEDEAASAETTSINGQCHITFRYRDQSLEAQAADYFEALCMIRAKLEAERLIPFCYGASLNVFPSGMSRDMGGGMLAYRLTHGKKPDRADLVGVFDEGPDVIPASVALQREYFEVWLKSTVG